jgi:hypothetical protein
MTQFPPSHPRNRGSIFKLPEPGEITAMVPSRDALIVYQPQRVYRVRTPDVIDPDGTNPGVPSVVEIACTYGSSHPAVARVFLQAHEMLKVANCDATLDQAKVQDALFALSEDLVVCAQAADAVGSQVDRIVAQVAAAGLNVQNAGRLINPLPQVNGLDDHVTSFLIRAKRAIRATCTLVATFMEVPDTDSNFDHLKKRLDAAGHGASEMARLVTARAAGVRYFIERRNGQEHPSSPTRTVVENVRLMPDLTIRMPIWRLDGASPSQPDDAAAQMRGGIEILIDVAEMLIIYGVMHRRHPKLQLALVETPSASRDPSCPIRYRLEPHFS